MVQASDPTKDSTGNHGYSLELGIGDTFSVPLPSFLSDIGNEITGKNPYTPEKYATVAFDPSTYALGTQGADQYSPLAEAAQQRRGPTFSPELMRMLTVAAEGSAPSAAQLQGQQQLDTILKNQLAARGADRGGRTGASARLLNESATAARLGSSAEAAQLRASEMAQARGLLSQVQGQQMSSDLSQAELNDAMTKYYMTQGYTLDEANRQAQITAANLQATIGLTERGHNTEALGAGLSAGGALVSGVGKMVAGGA
jgi:hypothetical protein